MWPFRRRRPTPTFDAPVYPLADLAADYEARRRVAQEKRQAAFEVALGLNPKEKP